MEGERTPVLPPNAELPVRPGLPPTCAWAVFGADDQVGTLNLITSDTVAHAASLVRRGVIFPLNWRVDHPGPAIMGRASLRRTQVTSLDPPVSDDYLDSYYPQSSSQWDALKHVGNRTYGFYNGRSIADVLHSEDETLLGIQTWADRGIAGRFVLADVARFFATRGGLDPTQSIAITPEDIEATLSAQNVTLECGDILLIRFGWLRWYEELLIDERKALAGKPMFPSPGLAPDDHTIEWLWNHRVAALATDNPMVEVMPAAEDQLHYRLIPLLGMAVGEMFYLERLADDCAASGVYDGLFTAAPLNIPGGSGSPANAIALK